MARAEFQAIEPYNQHDRKVQLKRPSIERLLRKEVKSPNQNDI